MACMCRGDHMGAQGRSQVYVIFMACMCRGDHMGAQERSHVYVNFYGVYVQGRSHECAGEITCIC